MIWGSSIASLNCAYLRSNRELSKVLAAWTTVIKQAKRVGILVACAHRDRRIHHIKPSYVSRRKAKRLHPMKQHSCASVILPWVLSLLWLATGHCCFELWQSGYVLLIGTLLCLVILCLLTMNNYSYQHSEKCGMSLTHSLRDGMTASLFLSFGPKTLRQSLLRFWFKSLDVTNRFPSPRTLCFHASGLWQSSYHEAETRWTKRRSHDCLSWQSFGLPCIISIQCLQATVAC